MYSLYQSKAEACLLQLVNIISFSLEEFCQICYCIYFSGFCVSIGNFIFLNEATHSTQGSLQIDLVIHLLSSGT